MSNHAFCRELIEEFIKFIIMPKRKDVNILDIIEIVNDWLQDLGKYRCVNVKELRYSVVKCIDSNVDACFNALATLYKAYTYHQRLSRIEKPLRRLIARVEKIIINMMITISQKLRLI